MGEVCGGRLHGMSCYAPTRAAKREVKDAFFQVLYYMLASVPLGEKYMLGDFNARAEFGECVED